MHSIIAHEEKTIHPDGSESIRQSFTVKDGKGTIKRRDYRNGPTVISTIEQKYKSGRPSLEKTTEKLAGVISLPSFKRKNTFDDSDSSIDDIDQIFKEKIGSIENKVKIKEIEENNVEVKLVDKCNKKGWIDRWCGTRVFDNQKCIYNGCGGKAYYLGSFQIIRRSKDSRYLAPICSVCAKDKLSKEDYYDTKKRIKYLEVKKK